jgi:methionine-rich copper-binding protein CopC
LGIYRALALGAALIASATAFGHAKLLSAMPPADSRLAAAPASMTLKFNENVRLALLRLTSAGHAIPVTLDPNAAAASTITVKLPPLAAGTYFVQWSALTLSDGHVAKGDYSFSIR